MIHQLKNSIIFFLLTLSTCLSAQTNTVLSTGTWFKIGVTKSGIYKLDANFFQKSGFNLNQINPQYIKVYGNGGAMLPQKNSIARPTTLQENAIAVEGETDGKFDNSDYVLFYGQSPHQVYYDTSEKLIKHQLNSYSDTTFYFLTISDTQGRRIATSENNAVVTKQITSYDDFQYHEVDQKNILAQAPFAGSGREWFGEYLTESQQFFSFDVTNIVANSPITIKSAVVGNLAIQSTCDLTLNNQLLGSQTIESTSTYQYDYKGKLSTQNFTTTSDGSNTLKIGILHNKKGLSTGSGYLNYLTINYQRQLQWNNLPFQFRTIESTTNTGLSYQIAKATDGLLIWDITNPLVPVKQKTTVQNGIMAFDDAGKKLKEYILFNQEVLSPESIRVIPNQNLHAANVPDMVIVCADRIRSEANRLAAFRKQNDNLEVLVVSSQEIYNEFSSGKQDITAIRDFMKYLYDRNPSRLKYLLLFGDTSYDYKKRSNVIENETKDIYLPSYESLESLHPINSYMSDDYFGFLQNDEGEWTESDLGNHTLDIGIGRLPVKSLQEARDVVNKLIHYADLTTTKGEWQRKICFIADDGDLNIHQKDAQGFAEEVNMQASSFKTEKIYLDAYPKISLAEGQRSPAANLAINQTLKNGTLIVNYNGHGSESGWSEEQVLTSGDILKWTNYNNMPLMLTATCQFGRFDDPNQVSGAELAILNKQGGAIALLTTTRPVYQSSNHLINQAFYEAVFKPIDKNMPRLGDILIYTKNNSLVGVVNRNFTLLGDPSMKLNYPSSEIILASMNGKNIENSDTLKAQRQITLKGEIKDRFTGLKRGNFTGRGTIIVYDKPKKLQTLGNDGNAFAYEDYSNMLFQGAINIKGGNFSSSFILPKDIDYQYGKGKIMLFASDSLTGETGTGGFLPIIGGAVNSTEIDTIAPKIIVSINNQETRSIVKTSSPILVIELSDLNGINLSNQGLGHQLILTLDDTLQINLTNFYIAKEGIFSSGTINYLMSNLTEGKHQLKIKAWDTYNNSKEVTLEFEVNTTINTNLTNVYCYPNPVSHTTTFSFEHERVGDDFLVMLRIYDSLGQLIKEQRNYLYQVASPCKEIMLDLIEDSSIFVRGIYFYRIFVQSLTTSYKKSGDGKLMSIK